MKPVRILITGGHITPAIAVIEELQNRFPDWDILVVGRKYAREGDNTVANEYHLVREKGIQFISLTTGRLQRMWTHFSIFSLIKVPIGLVQAFAVCRKARPSCIVSFGGYVAFPIAIAGFALKIPILTHEQTTKSGLTNRIIAKMAKKICISFPESQKEFPEEKTIYTGLPIRASLFHPPPKPSFYIAPDRLLYITGGSTGAETLNELIFPLLPGLLSRFSILHQTGPVSFPKANKVWFALPKKLHNQYYPTVYLNTSDLSWVYNRAVLIIGRSGANTVGEIAALGKVALFIPLPWAAADEQTENAEVLVRAGSARFINQREFTANNFEQVVAWIMKHHQALESAAYSFRKIQPANASGRVVDEIYSLVQTT